jgi:hypothetical protein
VSQPDRVKMGLLVYSYQDLGKKIAGGNKKAPVA